MYVCPLASYVDKYLLYDGAHTYYNNAPQGPVQNKEEVIFASIFMLNSPIGGAQSLYVITNKYGFRVANHLSGVFPV